MRFVIDNCCLIIIINFISCCLFISEHPLLLIIAFDGMRWDYINPTRTPYLWNLKKCGVFAPNGIKPTVRTVTAANFYSMSTGLYQENSGIIGNTFWDPDLKERYDYWNFLGNRTQQARSRDAKWYNGEPIWQTNEKHSPTRLSGAMRWPHCDSKINHKNMTNCLPLNGYHGLEKWKSDIDTLIEWFTYPKNPINFGMYYCTEPDYTQHYYDIYSDRVAQVIMDTDQLVKYVMEKLKQNGLIDRINVIFTADHGHANCYKPSNLINLDKIFEKNEYIFSAYSLFPGTKGAEYLYSKLKKVQERSPNFHLWWKEEVPNEFHYKNSKRVGPVVMMEYLGYWITWYGDKPAKDDPTISGWHGYSNSYQEMWPFFLAVGRDFKENYLTTAAGETIESVDLYSLMCHLLKVPPAPNDGNFNRIKHVLKGSTSGVRSCLSWIACFYYLIIR